MDAYRLNIYPAACVGNSLAEPYAGAVEKPLFGLRFVQFADVCTDLSQEEIRHVYHAVALLGLWRLVDVHAAYISQCLIDGYGLL